MPRVGATSHPRPGVAKRGIEDRIAALEAAVRSHRRDEAEGEQFDDNSGLVFYDYEQGSAGAPLQTLAANQTRDFTLTVPAQIPTLQQRAGTRFELDAESRVRNSMDGGLDATLFIMVNGVTVVDSANLFNSGVAFTHGGTLRHFAVTDVAGGLFVVTARVSNASTTPLNVYFTQIKVRRGRPAGL